MERVVGESIKRSNLMTLSLLENRRLVAIITILLFNSNTDTMQTAISKALRDDNLDQEEIEKILRDAVQTQQMWQGRELGFLAYNAVYNSEKEDLSLAEKLPVFTLLITAQIELIKVQCFGLLDEDLT